MTTSRFGKLVLFLFFIAATAVTAAEARVDAAAEESPRVESAQGPRDAP